MHHCIFPPLHTHRYICALTLGEGTTSLGCQMGFRILEFILLANFIF